MSEFAPTNIVAIPGDKLAMIHWSPPLKIDELIVLYSVKCINGDHTATVMKSGMSGRIPTSTIIGGLHNHTTYIFIVSAVTENKNHYSSLPFSVTPSDSLRLLGGPKPSVVPGPPTQLSGTAGNGSVFVYWTAPPAIPTLTSYKITYVWGPVGRLNTLTIAGIPVSTTIYTIGGLTNNTTYTITIQAVNSSGTSIPSNVLILTPRTPTIVVPERPELTGAPGNKTAILSWLDKGGTAATKYTITQTSVGKTYPQIVITSPLNQTINTKTITGLTNGTAYTFSITSTNTAGTSPASNSIQITPGRPDKPTDVSSVAGNGVANIRWTAPVNTGGTPIGIYYITATDLSGGSPPPPASLIPAATGGLAQLTYLFSGLTNSHVYQFEITARNSTLTSLKSAPNNCLIGLVSAAPTNLTARALPIGQVVRLKWRAARTGLNLPILSYDISYNNISLETPPVVVHDVSGSLVTDYANWPGTFLTYDISGLFNADQYTFTVTANNYIGVSLPSLPITCQPDIISSAPFNVWGSILDLSGVGISQVAGNNRTINLVWTAPISVGSGVINYSITYTPTGPIPITDVSGNFGLTWPFASSPSVATQKAKVTVQTPDANPLYSIVGVPQDTIFDITIAAINDAGISDPSVELKVIT